MSKNNLYFLPMEAQKITQYFSKWRKEWVKFGSEEYPFIPTEGEILAMKKYFYELK